ncbi:DUF2690 domain-containing protein [Sphaerisporangium sp. B11E5]|uniref:DUF2690 domain-containing protein n=1 Tax=Sphaerisporangium sp. B11E5 TaxID=3153563 RepID=UPI00325C51D6
MRKLRQMIQTAIGALVLFAAAFATSGPVMAAGCSGTGCNGKDPIAMGCADSRAYDVYTREINYGGTNLSATMRVILRYSPTCGTNWAKVEVTRSNPSNYSFQIALTLQDSGYNTVSGTSHGTVGRSGYGNMYYAPTTPMRACGVLSTFGGGYQCTNAG